MKSVARRAADAGVGTVKFLGVCVLVIVGVVVMFLVIPETLRFLVTGGWLR